MKYVALTIEPHLADLQNRQIQETVGRERQRLLSFIRQRIPRQDDAEDILQDVFQEFTEMYRLMKPIEQIASWLFTVARNKITDRYRKKKPLLLEDVFSFNNGANGGFVTPFTPCLRVVFGRNRCTFGCPITCPLLVRVSCCFTIIKDLWAKKNWQSP